MDKFDFINRVMSMYPFHIRDSGVDAYYDKYKRALGGLNVDYEKLFDIFSTEYEDKTPPTGKWLNEKAKLCRIDTPCAERYRHVEVFDPRFNGKVDICFEGNPTDEQILKTLDKRYPGHTGWRIL